MASLGWDGAGAPGGAQKARARRVLKLPKQVVAALKAHHKGQAAERLKAGEATCDHDLVFCRVDGTPLDRWQVRRDRDRLPARDQARANQGRDRNGQDPQAQEEQARLPLAGEWLPYGLP
jgi:hypothetical protein